MSVPKKKRTSGSRKRRASHNALKVVNLKKCSKCGVAKLPHHACSKCGNYKGKEVLKIKSTLDKKKKK
ncbi:MAG: 50S ribosomal protein L32 [Parcubacteria group bacterium CG1_02_37_51]|uniref:Large ribosomal subunit protein bL32 n=2 Tax=Candidatus Komeiliibacteriota TaxID=1817908 RepID=A0A2M8DRP5_9BACT|nr:MAG: 50S ribosomal protein L32 [Parcubacteria group bacterium CG1_02_37_51]PIY94986.1 MAG: 50S ribosomal protein L32 [Candidatus Komeilibacteria bacterium CG_4_10_14_0_8_um_filter_37_78]PJC02054.1 MAG: 50S ribosomal protein L32 [Candidatus Komeilibacteria bacterium CG_4_9_14_0_8_um_filter_36_9]